MRLLRLSEVEIGSHDRVFRHPRLRASILWLAGFCGASAMFLSALAGKWKPGYIVSAALLPFLLLTLRFVTARFHHSNWLVRANEAGVFGQFRSYLNYPLSPDEPTVVFIPYGEILSARLVRERVETPDQSHPDASQTQYLRYIELELSGDAAALADALQTERSEKAPVAKHWYGSSSTLYPSAAKINRSNCATSRAAGRSSPPSTSRGNCTAAAWWRRRKWWRG